MATTKEHVERAEGTYVTHSRWPDPKSGPWLFAKIEHIYGDRTVESVEFPASEAEGVLEDLAAIETAVIGWRVRESPASPTLPEYAEDLWDERQMLGCVIPERDGAGIVWYAHAEGNLGTRPNIADAKLLVEAAVPVYL